MWHTRAAPGHPKGAQGLQNALGGARHSPGQGMEGTRAAPSVVCGVNAMGSKSLVPPSRVSARPRCAPLAHGRTPGPVLLLPGKRGVAVMEHRDPAWDNDDPWPSSSSSGLPAAPPASLAPCRSRRAAPSVPRVGSTSPPGFVCSRCASVPFIVLLVLPRGSSSMLLVSLINFPCAESSPVTFSKVPGAARGAQPLAAVRARGRGVGKVPGGKGIGDDGLQPAEHEPTEITWPAGPGK